jgi:hypothetical protein
MVHTIMCSTQVYPGLTSPYHTQSKRTDKDKHSSLLVRGFIDKGKKVLEPKDIFVRNNKKVAVLFFKSQHCWTSSGLYYKHIFTIVSDNCK